MGVMERKCEKCGCDLAVELETTVCNACGSFLIKEAQANKERQIERKKKQVTQMKASSLGTSIFGVILTGVSLLFLAFPALTGLFMFSALLAVPVSINGIVWGKRGIKSGGEKKHNFAAGLIIGMIALTGATTIFVITLVSLIIGG